MIQKKYPIALEIAGPTALWARPDTGDSPISGPCPTPSAIRAIFESILWGPDILIIPKKVEICSPIRYHSYVTNYGGPLRDGKAIKSGNSYRLFATVLVDVCYRLYADVTANNEKAKLNATAMEWDKRTTSPGHAYQAIFNRRLEKGQSFAIPSLGWKEFTPSYFGPFRPETKVCTDIPDIVIPSMLNQVFSDGYSSEYHPTFYQNLTIHEGILIFPERQ